MNTSEREQSLDGIRSRVAQAAAGWAPGNPDAEWLLSELDAACKALHDRNEETGYAEGFTAGVEAERERCAGLAREEAERYAENARRCDAAGNTHAGTMDTVGSLACERVLAAILGNAKQAALMRSLSYPELTPPPPRH